MHGRRRRGDIFGNDIDISRKDKPHHIGGTGDSVLSGYLQKFVLQHIGCCRWKIFDIIGYPYRERKPFGVGHILGLQVVGNKPR